MTLVTIEEAHILAKMIKESSSKVEAIELFGSVLKNGKGHDVDFMLIVNDELASKFWSITSDINPKLSPHLLFARKVIKKILPYIDEAFVKKVEESRRLRASKLIGLDLDRLA